MSARRATSGTKASQARGEKPAGKSADAKASSAKGTAKKSKPEAKKAVPKTKPAPKASPPAKSPAAKAVITKPSAGARAPKSTEIEAPKAKAAPLKPKAEAPKVKVEAPRAKAEASKPKVEAPKPKAEAPKAKTEAPKAKAEAPKKSKEPSAPAIPAVPARSEEVKMKSMTEEAAPAAKGRSVLRIAAGTRTPKLKKKTEAETAPNTKRELRAFTTRKAEERGETPKVEINPRLESSRGKIAAPVPLADGEKKDKPMSVAAKNRAAAEAAFQRVASPIETKPEPPPNGSTTTPHKSAFEMRISERDALTTTLRLADKREPALSAARELAQRFQLPPDQGLLVKVITLGEAGLAKLALEELLELDDRGRVRRTPDLKAALDALRSEDRETIELKDLLLEKIGTFSS